MPVVLVTDADQDFAELAQMFLTRRGYVAETATGGLECLDKLRRLSPNVLVLDRELPWGGGDGVLAYLREERLSVAPSVVLTTREHDCPPELLGAPVVGCLRKPFALADLLVSIAAVQGVQEVWKGAAAPSRCANTPPESGLTTPAGRKPAVLVVDDEEAVRNILRIGLEIQGFDVCLAANGAEALNLCRDQHKPFAAVLLDVRMPGQDGPQTLRELQRLAPQVPCCFMTGDFTSYGMGELLDRGASAVFAKPFRLNEVGAVLQRLVKDRPEGVGGTMAVPAG